MTKNVNRFTSEIYRALITCVILQLIEVPVFYRNQRLDKLRYLQLELSR